MLERADLPMGMFRREEFSLSELRLEAGHGMLIYSDGVSEALDESGAEYGIERLHRLIGQKHVEGPSALLNACRDDLAAFRRNVPKADDVTLFVLGRDGVAGNFDQLHYVRA